MQMTTKYHINYRHVALQRVGERVDVDDPAQRISDRARATGCVDDVWVDVPRVDVHRVTAQQMPNLTRPSDTSDHD